MKQLRVQLERTMIERRINRKQLADYLGMRYATLSDIYTGKRKPTLETLEQVMNGLECLSGQAVTLGDLLEAVEIPTDPLEGLLEPSESVPNLDKVMSPRALNGIRRVPTKVTFSSSSAKVVSEGRGE